MLRSFLGQKPVSSATPGIGAGHWWPSRPSSETSTNSWHSSFKSSSSAFPVSCWHWNGHLVETSWSTSEDCVSWLSLHRLAFARRLTFVAQITRFDRCSIRLTLLVTIWDAARNFDWLTWLVSSQNHACSMMVSNYSKKWLYSVFMILRNPYYFTAILRPCCLFTPLTWTPLLRVGSAGDWAMGYTALHNGSTSYYPSVSNSYQGHP